MKIMRLLRKIRDSFVNQHKLVQSYRGLTHLIARAEKRMRVRPICPYCGAEMMFRHSAISGGGIGAPKGSPVRDDQAWKCPYCFHTSHFGIPITKGEALEELKLRRGRHLTRPTYRPDEAHRRDVRRRLKALGYIDFEV